MAFEKGHEIVKSLELLEPYMSLDELISIRDRTAGRSITEESDRAYDVISQITALMVKQRLDSE
jgi:hypothetical protein